MAIPETADARKALMDAYKARRANRRGGGPLRGTKRRALSTRGRTIYSTKQQEKEEDAEEEDAVLRELARIDAEEAARPRGVASGDAEERTEEVRPGPSCAEVAMADELFALYIHI